MPYGLVGLGAAALFRALGWVRVSVWRGGALHIIAEGPLARRLHAAGWGGFTLGWTIFFWSVPSQLMLAHEERHVWQGLVLGVLFLPVYLACLGALYAWALGASIGRGALRRQHLTDVLIDAAARAYELHPLERDARRAAEKALPAQS